MHSTFQETVWTDKFIQVTGPAYNNCGNDNQKAIQCITVHSGNIHNEKQDSPELLEEQVCVVNVFT